MDRGHFIFKSLMINEISGNGPEGLLKGCEGLKGLLKGLVLVKNAPLAEAILNYIGYRIMRHGNKTIVFEEA